MSRMYFMVLLNSSKLYKEKQKNIRQSMVTILTMVIYHLSSKCSIQFASVKNTCTAVFVFVTEWSLNLMLLPESQTKYALTMLWTRVQTNQSTWFINGVILSFILLWALRLFGVFHFAVKVFSDNVIYMSRFICFSVDFLHIFIGDHVENQQVWWKIELWISEICILNTGVPFEFEVIYIYIL